MAKAPFNLAHSAAAVTLARYFAKRAVKDEWRKAGLKPRAVEELSLGACAIPARALGRANREAQVNLAEWKLRTKYPFPACK
jgi:hypothetical protein